MKRIISLLWVLTLLTGCDNSYQETNTYEETETQAYHQYVDIKYRDDDVDIGSDNFEELDASKSSFVRGAWYDDDNDYMVMNLDGIYYHYCGMTGSTWSSFKRADSFGSYYNKYIKSNYDCRYNYVPNY
jgi:hypothetical protein